MQYFYLLLCLKKKKKKTKWATIEFLRRVRPMTISNLIRPTKNTQKKEKKKKKERFLLPGFEPRFYNHHQELPL